VQRFTSYRDNGETKKTLRRCLKSILSSLSRTVINVVNVPCRNNVAIPEDPMISKPADVSRVSWTRVEVEVVSRQHVDIVQHEAVELAELPRHLVADVQQRAAVKQIRANLNSVTTNAFQPDSLFICSYTPKIFQKVYAFTLLKSKQKVISCAADMQTRQWSCDSTKQKLHYFDLSFSVRYSK